MIFELRRITPNGEDLFIQNYPHSTRVKEVMQDMDNLQRQYPNDKIIVDTHN